MSDDRWRDGVVGAALPPPEEPWFLREARRQREAGSRRPETKPPAAGGDAVYAAAASPVTDADDPASAGSPPARPSVLRRWWPFAAGAGIAVAAFAGLGFGETSVRARRPAPTLPRSTVRTVAAPAATPALGCGAPSLLEDLRAAIAARSREAGARDAGLLRQAMARLSVGTPAADPAQSGGCTASLSLWLPDAGGEPRELVARATFTVSQDFDGRARVGSVEGIGELVARLVAAPSDLAIAAAATDPAPVALPSPPHAVETAQVDAPLPAAPRTAPPPDAPDAGDPCSAADGFADAAVCNEPALAAMDDRLSTLLAGITRNADRYTAAAARDGQARFLDRRDRCGDEACIARVYRRRIAELEDFGYPPG